MVLHYVFFLMFLISSMLFLVLSLCVTLLGSSVIVSFSAFSSWFFDLSVIVCVDMMSSWFSFSVLLISSVIIIYSYFYMSPYSNPGYFIWITSFFVISILIVINFTSIFFLMLGWDGLGLVSFFLIVFYQNQSCITSGLFTVIINRVGDCFFISSISFVVLFYPLFNISGSFLVSLLSVFLVVTFITNSAIFPFSSWLPLAMAAPTPISALVHSSTLVTAGLYLTMRFCYVIYSNYWLVYAILVLSVFTSFYAGLNAVFENDMNNLIALSTLSHLGFIGMAFSCGILYLSFFHLLVHAFFKSLLFISMGDIITNLFHSQDVRFLSSGFVLTPSSFFIMSVSLLNLLGLPSISGFFSKDLVLETCNFSFLSFTLFVIVFVNVVFTYYYTYQLFYFCFQSIKSLPYMGVLSPLCSHSVLLMILGCLSVVFGWFWVHCVFVSAIHVYLPVVTNLTPLILNFLIFCVVVLFLNLPSSFNPVVNFYFSNMMALSCVSISLMSSLYVSVAFVASNSVELGFYSGVLNSSVSDIISKVSMVSFFFSLINPVFLLLIFSVLVVGLMGV